jgi:hypothetical protein
LDELTQDYINPKKVRMARAFLRYWRYELDIPLHKPFEYSRSWGLPVDGFETVSAFELQEGLDILLARKAIRVYRRGSPVGSKPNQYVLLKPKI